MNSSKSSSTSRKPFRFYRTMNKKVCSDRGFQILIKKNHKFKALECKEYYLPDSLTENNQLQKKTLRFLRKTLRQNKSLSSLKFLIHGTQSAHTDLIRSSLKNLCSLSTFHLKYVHPESVTPGICQSFTRCLRNLKQLVNIDYNIYSKLQVKKFAHQNPRPFRNLSPLRVLNRLSIEFSWSKFLNDQWIFFLSSLKFLSLKLTQSQAITQLVFDYLFKSIGQLSLLEALHLQVGKSDINFIDLFQNLKDLPHFQELSLGIIESLTDSSFIIGLALLDPSKLKRITVGFGSKVSDSQLSEFFCLLQRFSSLTHLGLAFSQSGVTYQGFLNLPEGLMNLQHLDLKFSDQSDISLILDVTSSYLGTLENLTSFRIHTTGKGDVDDFVVRGILWSLTVSEKLKYLCLNFERRQYLYGASLENLTQVLTQVLALLPALEELEVNFEGIKKLNNEGTRSLMKSFEGLKSLKELSLNFSLCPEVNGECFDALIRSLGSLPLLKTISLTLGDVLEHHGIERYQELTKFLGNMEALTEITLKFCPFKRKELDENIECIVRNENSKKYINIL